MTYEIYRYIFIICGILSLVMLIVAAVLFVVLKIPVVIGDITGANARKAIENIRNQNEASGDKIYKSSHVNKERGKLTEKISPSGSLIRNHTEALGGAMSTSKLGTEKLLQEAQDAHAAANETTLLEGASGAFNETTLLDGVKGAFNETTLLGGVNGTFSETTLLDGWNSVSPETTVLSQELRPDMNPVPQPVVFEIEFDITYVHTDEVIV